MKYRTYAFFCALISISVILSAHALSGTDFVLPAWKMEEPNSYTIVLDPGHGGEDGGATTAQGLCESQLNLEISLRVRDLLHFIGGKTRMIRENDCSVSTEGTTIARRKVSDIRNRVRIAEETPNALLLSIHQNHFSQGKYRGAQVFFAETQGSQAWAEAMQGIFRTQLDPNNRRQCKTARDIYLLEHIRCPGILVECGFLSNYEEAALLQEASYQKKLAAAIACCTMSYLEEQNEI